MTLPIRSARDVQGEALETFTRKVLFAPSLGNCQYQRMAIVSAQPGSRNQAHTHPGNEAVYTLQGESVFEIAEREYRVGAGRALMIPPNTPHQRLTTSDAPWISVCFYCDECPALAAYRATGGALRTEQPRVVSADEIAPEQLGELRRRILYTPSRDGVNFLRLGVVEGPPRCERRGSHTPRERMLSNLEWASDVDRQWRTPRCQPELWNCHSAGNRTSAD